MMYPVKKTKKSRFDVSTDAHSVDVTKFCPEDRKAIAEAFSSHFPKTKEPETRVVEKFTVAGGWNNLTLSYNTPLPPEAIKANLTRAVSELRSILEMDIAETIKKLEDEIKEYEA